MLPKHLTKDQLIRMLVELGDTLGRAPTRKDTGPVNGIPSYKTYVEAFDSWNNALRAAGFIPHNQVTNADELILTLRTWHEKHGRIPKVHELRRLGLPSRSTLSKYFGSCGKAWKATGIEVGQIAIGLRGNLGRDFAGPTVTVDFSRHPHIYEAIVRQADIDLRTPENQVIYLIREALKTDGR
jgi:hypothetical protein